MNYLTLPSSIAIGDFIHFVHQQMTNEAGMKLRYTFSGSVYFERMQHSGLYSINDLEIRERIKKQQLINIYQTGLV